MPPPNLKGGKNYKKKAKGGEVDIAQLQIDRLPDQQVARVIRVLGNRNMMCYCNDNTMRICHVRGKMRNRVYVEQGDVVLVSLRDYAATSTAATSTAATSTAATSDKQSGAAKTEADRGDILFKYPYEYLSKLKKEDGINPKLFMTLETMDGIRIGAVGNTIEGDGDAGGGFEFDREGADSGSDSDSDSEELDIDAI